MVFVGAQVKREDDTDATRYDDAGLVLYCALLWPIIIHQAFLGRTWQDLAFPELALV